MCHQKNLKAALKPRLLTTRLSSRAVGRGDLTNRFTYEEVRRALVLSVTTLELLTVSRQKRVSAVTSLS